MIFCSAVPMGAHILQVAYYDALGEIRTQLLNAAGYQVTTALSNAQAMGLDAGLIASVDLVIVGFPAPHSARAAMVHWLKAQYPSIPVIVLQFYDWETFPEADAATLSEDPTIWLAAVASALKS